MNRQIIRFILGVAVVWVGINLFYKYQESNRIQSGNYSGDLKKPQAITRSDPNTYEKAAIQDLPDPINNTNLPNANQDATALTTSDLDLTKPDHNNLAVITTDLLKIQINRHGDLVFTELTGYPQQKDQPEQGFKVFTQETNRFYIAQSGLLSDLGPDSKNYGRAKFTTKKTMYVLPDNEDCLVVDLNYINPEKPGINITKRFKFHRNSYIIDLSYIINNQSNVEYHGSLYGRLKRNQVNVSTSLFSGGGLRTYTGAVISTPAQKYKKLPFSDMIKNPYKVSVNGGWVAMLEHYFVSAWIPDPNNLSEYQTETFNNNIFGIRFVNSAINVPAGTEKTVSARLFIGPKVVDLLKEAAPGLDLTVDYGILWILCVPLFWLLKSIYNLIGNWGWSIIFTTIVVKLLFYKLSAYSYHSMGNLKKIQPKIEELKARCGEDKQKFSQSIMELYRNEKVNPLGGCLPIILQIPVFIALYYVLLESVELRQAPWGLWVKDLSAKDPWYILPCLMGVSMLIQQKINPAPTDPVQAKVLMLLPLIFSVLFLQFPSGLMLYWVVNNTLSILQQLFITKNLATNKC